MKQLVIAHFLALSLFLQLISLTTPHPLPESVEPTHPPLALKVLPQPTGDDDAAIEIDAGDDDGSSKPDSSSSKRHYTTSSTPSPAELEERRQAFIKSLGGGEDSGSVLVGSLQGLGSLATDFVSLLTTNANETFAPLREAKQKARENFPDFGTTLNNYFRNGRQYATRVYRGFIKNARVKITNLLRFMLSAVTRLSSTVGGLYNVLISLLDVATRSVQTGARVGSRLLAVGSNFTVNALARGTNTLRSIGESGVLVKPLNQIVQVGRGLGKGLSEDLFDKVEWAQEGLNSKLELAQALAPNFLLRAHERTTPSPSSSSTELSYTPPEQDSLPSPPELYVSYQAGGGGSASPGGYAKITENEDELALSALASAASELMMMREGRGVEESSSITKNGTTSSTLPPLPPQNLLNDIFGLEEEIKELKKNVTLTMSHHEKDDDDSKTNS